MYSRLDLIMDGKKLIVFDFTIWHLKHKAHFVAAVRSNPTTDVRNDPTILFSPMGSMCTSS